MNLKDALFNWLQISIVAEARPADHAAGETKDFFEVILREDHHLSEFDYSEDGPAIFVRYTLAGDRHTERFDRELAEQLLTDINSNPKYNEI